MRTHAIQTVALLAILGSCVGDNPAYRGPVGSAPVDLSDAAVEVLPSSADAAVDMKVRDADAPEVVGIEGPPTKTPAPMPRLALLVVGDLNLDPMDVQSSERLAALGFTVTIELDAVAAPGDAAGMDVVIISGSTSSSKIGGKFKSVAVPIICHDSWDFPLMGLTGSTGGTDYGRDDNDAPPDTRIALLVSHALGANLTGVVNVTDKAIGISWGHPLPEATAVASLVGDPSRITLFGYLEGAPLPDGTTAPARRVGSFVRNPSGARLAADGLRLFDAAVVWATAP
jgi:hypothetical protein